MMRCALVGLAGVAMLLFLGCGGDEEPAGGAGGGGTPPAQGESAGASTLAPEAQRLVGVWKEKVTPEGASEEAGKAKGGPGGMEMSIDFKDDGAVKMDMGMGMEMSGTWESLKAEGEKLTINMAMEMPSMGSPMESEEGAKEPAEKPKPKTVKKEMEFKIVFETDDRITMAPSDDPEDTKTLDRQK